MLRPRSCLFLSGLLFASLAGSARAAPAKLGDLRKVGAVGFKTSCNAAAQKSFSRGLALLHSFFYEEAKRGFEEASTADPKCAIAHWGIAATYYHPIWAPPDEASLKAGGDAIKKAQSLGGGKTDLEKGYIAAMAAFYDDTMPAPPAGQAPIGAPACHGDMKKAPDHSARARAWAAQIAKLHEAHPGDVEVASLHALALLGTAVPADKTLANPTKAAAVLEPFLAKYPDHPGVIHYYIHACDYPSMAQRALAAAKHYTEIAPWVPHVLHMPSHIFTRLGMWKESANANLASAEAARAYAASHHPGATSFEELHADDYLIFAYLQRGEDKKVDEIAKTVANVQKTVPEFDVAVAFALGAIPARIPLERGQWKAAAALTVPPSKSWAKFPFAEAHLHFARGLGAARTGQVDVAIAEAAKIAELRKLVQEPKFRHFAMQMEVEQTAVEAFIAHAQKKDADAERLLRKAADTDDLVGVHPVSPANILPARELLADLLLELGRPSDALKTYEASLAIRPNRYYALAGAIRAAHAAKDEASATRHKKALVELTKDGDKTRPEIADARTAIK